MVNYVEKLQRIVYEQT